MPMCKQRNMYMHMMYMCLPVNFQGYCEGQN